MVCKQMVTRISDNSNCLTDGHLLFVIELVLELHGMRMTVLPSVAVDIYLYVDWSLVFCAEMIDVINMQVINSPTQ